MAASGHRPGPPVSQPFTKEDDHGRLARPPADGDPGLSVRRPRPPAPRNPDRPERRRAHVHVVRPRLPGRRRHPRAAARRGEPACGHPRGASPGVLDDTLLADPRALAALDTGGVLRSAAMAGAQVRSAAHGAQEAGVPAMRGHRPRALVLVRRPGTSGAVAGLLTALLGPGCPVPVVTVDQVPVWVGPLDVVWAHTADATDADLADGVGRAVGRGAEVVLSAPHDGPVAAAGAGRVRLVEPRVPVPPGLDLPRGLAVGLAVVSALELLPSPLPPDLDALADAARRRGRAQPARSRAVHEPGQGARAAARRAHPAAVGHGRRGCRGRRPRRRGAGGPRGRGGQRGRRGPRGPRRPGCAARWTSPPAGATSSTTPSRTTWASPPRPRRGSCCSPPTTRSPAR